MRYPDALRGRDRLCRLSKNLPIRFAIGTIYECLVFRCLPAFISFRAGRCKYTNIRCYEPGGVFINAIKPGGAGLFNYLFSVHRCKQDCSLSEACVAAFIPVVEKMVGDIMLHAILFLRMTTLLPVFYHSKFLLSLLLIGFHLVFITKLSATMSFDKM